jgi:hypothetical protein
VGSSTCPFCKRNNLNRLGNHLPYCSQRNGRDYAPFLSNKTLAKKVSAGCCKTKFCPKCHKSFSRLDTHLRKSATCRDISQHDHSPVPAVVPALSGEPPSQQGSVCKVREPSLYELEFKPRLCLPTSAEGWKKANEHFEQGLVLRVILEPAVASMLYWWRECIPSLQLSLVLRNPGRSMVEGRATRD